jgi:ion channel-forming bestrophin family protein
MFQFQVHLRVGFLLTRFSACLQLGGCERLLGTPIPLSYTRHTSRCLILWLATLPMALWPCMGWATVPAMFAMCFIFVGIDEIGVEIEEPFCILPLMPMCKTIMRDVCDAMELAPRRQAQQA